jgi:hypothetical protein
MKLSPVVAALALLAQPVVAPAVAQQRTNAAPAAQGAAPGAAPGTASGAPQSGASAAALARSASALAAAKVELGERLRPYDAALTMRVLAGELTADAAARELARIAGEQARRPPSRGMSPETQAAHRQAAERLFAHIERRSATDAVWPRDKPSPEYRAFARFLLHQLRNGYNDALIRDDDAGMVLEDAEALLALTRGQAEFDTAKGLFAAADTRIAAAIAGIERAARAAPTATASAPPRAAGSIPPPVASHTPPSSKGAGTSTSVTTMRPAPGADQGTTSPGASSPGTTQGAALAPIPGPPTAVTMPPPRPSQASIGRPTLHWAGQSNDRVGRGASGQPDGGLDGQFRLGVQLPQRVEIKTITLFASDGEGRPVGDNRWHTQDSRFWILGAVVGGRLVNNTHVPTLGAFSGSFSIDLYAADKGVFKPGQAFTVEIEMGDGTRQRLITQVR